MRYYISHSWVTDIERGKFRPSVLMLRTLSLIYHCNYDEFLVLFAIPIGEAAREPTELLLPHTHLLGSQEPSGKAIVAPIELRTNVELEKTNLVARMFADWGEIPVRLFEQMDLQNSLYGYISKEGGVAWRSLFDVDRRALCLARPLCS